MTDPIQTMTGIAGSIRDQAENAQAVLDALHRGLAAEEALGNANITIADLQAQLAEAGASTADLERIRTLETALADAEGGRVTALAALGEAQEVIATLTTTLGDTSTKLDRATEEITFLRANWQPKPTPTKRRPLFGACPAASTTSQVLTKYGPKATVCWFDGKAGLTKIPTRPANCLRMEACWKMLGTPTTFDGKTDAQVDALTKAATVNLIPGDKVTLENELDVKHKEEVTEIGAAAADANLAKRIAYCNRFYDSIKRVRPDLDVTPKYAAWRWSARDAGVDRYLVKGDVLGVDLDGINTSYVNWADPAMLTKIVATAQQYFGGRWTAPEFGWPQLSSDPDGSVRRKAIQTQVAALLAMENPPEEIVWFDASGFSTYPLTGDDVPLWASLVAGNVG